MRLRKDYLLCKSGENIGTGIGAIGGLSLAFSGVKEGEVSSVPTKPKGQMSLLQTLCTPAVS